MSQVNKDQLKDMSVDDILNLTTEQIQEVTSMRLPVGMYAGTLVSFAIPEGDKDYFESCIRPTAVIELVEQTEEALAAAQNAINAGNDIKTRYYRKGGFGVQKMRTDFGALMDATVGAGQPMGAFFAHMSQGAEIACTFTVTHRKDKGSDAVYVDIRDVNPA